MADTSPVFNQGTKSSRPSTNGEAGHEIKDDAEALRRDISSLASTVSNLASDKLGDVQKTAEHKLSSVEASIRQNPTQSALIAVGVGFLFGLILTR
jgi:ElaB/YqjD/DUF883 family membrane-anchored ribosome-binding protein